MLRLERRQDTEQGTASFMVAQVALALVVLDRVEARVRDLAHKPVGGLRLALKVQPLAAPRETCEPQEVKQPWKTPEHKHRAQEEQPWCLFTDLGAQQHRHVETSHERELHASARKTPIDRRESIRRNFGFIPAVDQLPIFGFVRTGCNQEQTP